MSAKSPGVFGSKSLEDAIDKIWKASADARDYIEHEKGESFLAVAGRSKRVSLGGNMQVVGILMLLFSSGVFFGAVFSGGPLGIESVSAVGAYAVVFSYALLAIGGLIKWAAGK